MSDRKRAISSLETDEAYQLEYERTTKNDLGVDVHDNNVGNIDCISRADAIGSIAVECSAEKLDIDYAKFLKLRRAIKALPTITPQEPKSEWEQDHAILKAYSDGVNEVLDKIRAEIKALSPEPTAYDVVDGNPIKDAVWETLADVLQIIDKYKAESEDKE